MKYYLKHYGHMVLLRVTPFELVYGHEAVLPVEVNLAAYIG